MFRNAILILIVGCSSIANAFPLPEWPYSRLAKESDLIVIVQLEKTDLHPNPAQFSLRVSDENAEYLSLALSSFRVKHRMKGESKDNLSVEHFRYKVGPHHNMGNGPRLFEFRSGIQEFSGAGWAAAAEPEYLLFLKRVENGRFQLTGPPEHMPLSARIIFAPF